MKKYDYDLFVIGAGSGGVRAARRAAALGLRVGIAEGRYWGGTCVNRGCIPKKLYVYASHYNEDFSDAVAYGWQMGKQNPRFDWQTLQKNKDVEINRLNQVYINLLEKAGVIVHRAFAQFENEHSLQVNYTGENNKVASPLSVSAAKILVTSGSQPFLPEFIGKEYVSCSDDIFLQEKIPQRVVVVGGGYIAVEFAGIFAGLGCECTLVYRGPLFLRNFDKAIAEFFYKEMQKKDIRLCFQSDVKEIKKKTNGTLDVCLQKEIIHCDQVLYATGRKANIVPGLVEKAGVILDKRGYIEVDENFQTNIASIYALGDVIGRVQLTPIAIGEANHFVQQHFTDKASFPIDYSQVPTAIFSQPSIGTVGLSEEQARRDYGEVKIYQSNFQTLKHSLSKREERVMIKLVVNPKDERILGIHIVGGDAAEIIQSLAVAFRMGVTKPQLDSTLAVHPTLTEEFLSLRT